MSFRIDRAVFEQQPHLYIGAVVVKGVDNRTPNPSVKTFLDECVEQLTVAMKGVKAKEHPMVLPFRGAFNALGYNPNKFQPSIEALATRIEKGKGMPSINPIVDLGNAISLKYVLPLGAHPLNEMDEEVRFARKGDVFRPFGATEDEEPDVGELIYATGNIVGTRRWIWRQSEYSKVEADTTDVFVPIDGFIFIRDKVDAAVEELANRFIEFFGVTPSAVGIVHINNPELVF